MQGFISLHRKLMENPVWTDPYFLKLWTYCLFTASHKEHDLLVGNQIIKLERGQFVTGRFSLAEDLNKCMKPELKLSDRTWWRYLNSLQKTKMLSIKSTNKYSVVTIDKYDFYQNTANQADQQMSSKCPTDVQQMSTNNNGNKGNKKEYTPEFEEFWSIYPRKKEKAKAFSCWKTCLKNVSPELLITCGKNYAQEVNKQGTLEKFIKHPATFLGPSKPYEDYQHVKQEVKKVVPDVDPFLLKMKRLEEESRSSREMMQ